MPGGKRRRPHSCDDAVGQVGVLRVHLEENRGLIQRPLQPGSLTADGERQPARLTPLNLHELPVAPCLTRGDEEWGFGGESFLRHLHRAIIRMQPKSAGPLKATKATVNHRSSVACVALSGNRSSHSRHCERSEAIQQRRCATPDRHGLQTGFATTSE